MTNTKASGAPELDKCPFCGDDDIEARGYPLSGWRAICDGCGASCEGKHWNTRPALPDEAELVEIVNKGLHTSNQSKVSSRTVCLDILTALRPYLNDGKRVAVMTDALEGADSAMQGMCDLGMIEEGSWEYIKEALKAEDDK